MFVIPCADIDAPVVSHCVASIKEHMPDEGIYTVQTKEYEDLDQGVVTVHAFYVRYLLPIWFDVQCMEWAADAEPARQWQYA